MLALGISTENRSGIQIGDTVLMVARDERNRLHLYIDAPRDMPIRREKFMSAEMLGRLRTLRDRVFS